MLQQQKNFIKYCLDNGRAAICPIRMFRYLFLNQFTTCLIWMWLNDPDPILM